jgi:hypothetical protein
MWHMNIDRNELNARANAIAKKQWNESPLPEDLKEWGNQICGWNKPPVPFTGDDRVDVTDAGERNAMIRRSLTTRAFDEEVLPPLELREFLDGEMGADLSEAQLDHIEERVVDWMEQLYPLPKHIGYYLSFCEILANAGEPSPLELWVRGPNLLSLVQNREPVVEPPFLAGAQRLHVAVPREAQELSIVDAVGSLPIGRMSASVGQ